MEGNRGDLILVFTDWRAPVILVRTAHLLEALIFSKITVGVWWDNGEGNGNPLQYSCLGHPTEEPGRLQSVGSQRVRHNLATQQQHGRIGKDVGY